MPTKKEIIDVLKKINDPEIQIDIWTLELIREIHVEGSKVKIKMTLTTPACPYGPALIQEVESSVKALPGIKTVEIELVFSPPWQPSDEVKETLGLT